MFGSKKNRIAVYLFVSFLFFLFFVVSLLARAPQKNRYENSLRWWSWCHGSSRRVSCRSQRVEYHIKGLLAAFAFCLFLCWLVCWFVVVVVCLFVESRAVFLLVLLGFLGGFPYWPCVDFQNSQIRLKIHCQAWAEFFSRLWLRPKPLSEECVKSAKYCNYAHKCH